MKFFFTILFFFGNFYIYAQVINFPDQNFKNKLLQADINNQIAGATKNKTNKNGKTISYEKIFNVTVVYPSATPQPIVAVGEAGR